MTAPVDIDAIAKGFASADATVGVTGAIRIADLGTPYVPGIGAYTEKHQNLGYVSDDGVEESRDEDKQEWTPWQEFSPIREDITASKVSFKFVLWQVNGVTVPWYYGITAAQIIKNPDGSYQWDEGGKPQAAPSQMYIDIIDKGRVQRMILARAQISERGSIVFKSDEMVGFEVTITATPGPEGWSVRRLWLGYDFSAVDAAHAEAENPTPIMRTITLGDEAGDVTGGTFTLSFGGQTTSPIAFDATGNDVDAALEALSTIGSGKVSVSGPAGGPYQVVLDGSLTGSLTINGSNLTGDANPSVA